MYSIAQYYDKHPYDNAVESTCKTNTIQFKGLSISFIESYIPPIPHTDSFTKPFCELTSTFRS